MTALVITALAVSLSIAGSQPPRSAGSSPSLAVSDAHVTEGAEAVFKVRLSRAAPASVQVRFATSSGSAKSGDDYVARSGTLLFKRGERSKPVRIAVGDDGTAEPEETFFLVLSRGRGARIRDGRGTAVIQSSDLPRVFTLQADLTGAEQIPGPGAPNGRGTAVVSFDAEHESIAFTVTVTGVDRPTEAGIGRGSRGVPPMAAVVWFTHSFPASGTLVGAMRLELRTILELYAAPEAFYVGVHSASGGPESGGLRGQLSRKEVP